MKIFGGGGGSDGGMLRSLKSVGRAVSRSRESLGVPVTPPRSDPFSSSSSSHKEQLSSLLNPLSFPSARFLYAKKLSACADESEWVCVDGFERHGGYVIGPVPSHSEVDHAVSALQQVFADQVSSSDSKVSDPDWEEPSLSSYNSASLQPNNAYDRVYYAFHLLKNDPYVQRMVKSLSSDKVVWDAVLENEAVRELREAISADEEEHDPSDDDDDDGDDSFHARNFVVRIFESAGAIFKEIIEKITNLVNKLFQPIFNRRTHANAESLDAFNDKLRNSFILSIMVLMFVLLTRAQARV
ncbi:hypothetical protein HN51_034932 [Arachis hypogaea]|uniref:Uncharacterized protein n=1 Tax=Arachis hypogaea TaxID=3818 RepID=A0A445A6N4_ARAHY|nr:uncharacterized protein LOC107634197 isoform X2 [Arachis ipaensis]XP_025641057.1 uncharacterized protein LOC112735766 [Arachis hypogaea]QHN99835.1 hypothetical protein DS421_13g401280 [Arachis hypogaea]RYR22110.1 hypothetical protein Ahy_B03g067392 [Arachis hypogaea]